MAELSLRTNMSLSMLNNRVFPLFLIVTYGDQLEYSSLGSKFHQLGYGNRPTCIVHFHSPTDKKMGLTHTCA